ncbi:MAG: YceK/YidQ family lipoprotein [Gemmataceae bacterium]|nr:YceK/YidQ family lipoprotein [Gemmataceae bacterium]
MARTSALAALAGAAVWLGGCGTVANLGRPADQQRVFGGVRLDMEVVQECAGEVGQEGGPGNPAEAVVSATCSVLDMPLSLVGDVVTLPLTFLAELRQTNPTRSQDPVAPRDGQ